MCIRDRLSPIHLLPAVWTEAIKVVYVSAMLCWSDLKGHTILKKRTGKHAESGMLMQMTSRDLHAMQLKSLKTPCSLASHLGSLALKRNKKDDQLAAQKFTKHVYQRKDMSVTLQNSKNIKKLTWIGC